VRSAVGPGTATMGKALECSAGQPAGAGQPGFVYLVSQQSGESNSERTLRAEAGAR